MTRDRSNQFWLLVALSVMAGVVTALPSVPTNLSLRGLWDAVVLGEHIASGTVFPTVPAAGGRFTWLATPTSPAEYRSDGATWVRMIGGGGGGTASSHADLTELDFDSSGHTGFASAGSLADLASVGSLVGLASTGSLAGLASVGSLVGLASTGSLVGLASVGSIVGLASASALPSHIASHTDPHGATMTVTAGISVGTSSYDCRLFRESTGTVGIASYVYFQTCAASPTVAATGTLWVDASGTFRVQRYGVWDSFGKTYYAFLQANESATATTLTNQDEFYSITNVMSASSTGSPFITTSTDTIVIGNGGAGNYFIACSFSFSGSNDAVIEFRSFKNGVKVNNIGCERKINSSGDVGSAGMTGFVRCAAGDVIEVKAACVSAGSKSVTVKYKNIAAHRIGD